jgi:hypothetical protein
VRPLREEVRDVQASRRQRAAVEANETSEVSVEDVLATAYAEHTHEEDRQAESTGDENRETIPHG